MLDGRFKHRMHGLNPGTQLQCLRPSGLPNQTQLGAQKLRLFIEFPLQIEPSLLHIFNIVLIVIRVALPRGLLHIASRH